MSNWWDRQTTAIRLAVVFTPLIIAASFVTASFGAITTNSSHVTVSTSSSSSSTSPKPTTKRTPSATPTPSQTATPTPTARTGATGDALTFTALLAELPEDDSPTSHTGYARDLFNVWSDANGDGCNTRAEVLKAETTSPVTLHGTCTIDTGSWYSAYDGTWFTNAGDVDIDHFVPLSEAWKSGAWQWSSQTRVAYGNDLGYAASLLAVSASSNRSKSDQDPAQWLPTNRDFYCDYAATWVAVKWRWNLTVDSPERATLSNILSGCSTLTVTVPDRASITIDAGAQSGVPAHGGNGSSDGVVEPNFGTCKVAKANGYGPYIRGVDPEYDFYRDGDGDGKVCE